MLVLTRKVGQGLKIGDGLVIIEDVGQKNVFMTIETTAGKRAAVVGTDDRIAICDGAVLLIVKLAREKVRLGVGAPSHVAVVRQELLGREGVPGIE